MKVIHLLLAGVLCLASVVAYPRFTTCARQISSDSVSVQRTCQVGEDVKDCAVIMGDSVAAATLTTLPTCFRPSEQVTFSFEASDQLSVFHATSGSVAGGETCQGGQALRVSTSSLTSVEYTAPQSGDVEIMLIGASGYGSPVTRQFATGITIISNCTDNNSPAVAIEPVLTLYAAMLTLTAMLIA